MPRDWDNPHKLAVGDCIEVEGYLFSMVKFEYGTEYGIKFAKVEFRALLKIEDCKEAKKL